MLDELEAATTPTQHGFDQGINSFNNIGNRVVAMIGSAETWDAYGTPALRSAVIARWRTCWAIEGAAMLRGLVPETSLPAAGDREGRRKFNSSRRQFVRRII